MLYNIYIIYTIYIDTIGKLPKMVETFRLRIYHKLPIYLIPRILWDFCHLSGPPSYEGPVAPSCHHHRSGERRLSRRCMWRWSRRWALHRMEGKPWRRYEAPCILRGKNCIFICALAFRFLLGWGGCLGVLVGPGSSYKWNGVPK